MDGRRRQRIQRPFTIQSAQHHHRNDDFGEVLGGDLGRYVGKQMHSVNVVGLAGVYSNETCGSGRRCSRLARQPLKPLLFVVGKVYEDYGGDGVFGGVEKLGYLGKT